MHAHAPEARLGTHDVFNQPAPFAPRNLYLTDIPLRAAVRRAAGEGLDERLARLGAVLGEERVLDLGEAANRNPPELVSFDRYGRRLDEVRFHPAYHELMTLAMDHRIHDLAWAETGPGRHLLHLAPLALFTQAEAGVMCPVNMTYAAVPALRAAPAATRPWLDRLIGGRYDPALKPLAEKAGVTIGMAMTEKQGGSDVRANTTRAFPLDAGAGFYRLVGHKWFCSAPMSDAFLTLAHTEAGLSCFLVPRILPDGARNAIRLMRLKDKLGNRSNASAEIEYHDAGAVLVGPEGRGVNVIIEMVHHTRLGTVGATLGIMRMALAQAVNHVETRAAFGATLIDQPLMRAVIADLALEYEAAVALAIRTGAAFGETGEDAAAFARLSVALAKYWLTKRNPGFVYECMECLGGAGYVEDSPLPRLFRESPVNGIWEGSGNVIALDVIRTLARAPQAGAAFRAEIDAARGANRAYDAAATALEPGAPPEEGDARLLTERMALLLQASLLLRHAPAAVADAFCATRLGDAGGRMFGALKRVDVNGILARQRAGAA